MTILQLKQANVELPGISHNHLKLNRLIKILQYPGKIIANSLVIVKSGTLSAHNYIDDSVATHVFLSRYIQHLGIYYYIIIELKK